MAPNLSYLAVSAEIHVEDCETKAGSASTGAASPPRRCGQRRQLPPPARPAGLVATQGLRARVTAGRCGRLLLAFPRAPPGLTHGH